MEDLLNSVWARKLAREIAALKDREEGANRRVNLVRADIGDRCLLMKSKLKGDGGAFGAWCKANVHPDKQRIKEYIDLAEMRKKVRSFGLFLEFGPCKLARIAALPHEIAARLTPDTVLRVPGTELELPHSQLGAHKLDRALDALEGKKVAPPRDPQKMLEARLAELSDLLVQHPELAEKYGERLQAVAGCPNESLPSTREERAEHARKKTRDLQKIIAAVNKGMGSLSAAAKVAELEELEETRKTALKWAAWATPRRRAPLNPSP